MIHTSGEEIRSNFLVIELRIKLILVRNIIISKKLFLPLIFTLNQSWVSIFYTIPFSIVVIQVVFWFHVDFLDLRLLIRVIHLCVDCRIVVLCITIHHNRAYLSFVLICVDFVYVRNCLDTTDLNFRFLLLDCGTIRRLMIHTDDLIILFLQW